MNENENQPQDLPDYLRQEALAPNLEDTSTQAWTTFLSQNDDTGETKVVPLESSGEEVRESAVADGATIPTPSGSAKGERGLAADVPAETAEKSVESVSSEPEPAPASEPEPAPASEPEPAPASEPEPGVSSEPLTPETVTASTSLPEELNDLETTVVRRKSLLGGENTESYAPMKPEETQDSEPQWQPRQARLLGTDDQALNEATVLAGASIKPAKISRAGAHVTSLILSLLALPFAWAFLKHSSGMLYGGANSSWEQGTYSPEGLIYLVLGLGLVVIVGLAVRLSSLGMFVSGAILTVIGLAFVVAPFLMREIFEPTLTWLSESTIIAFRNLAYFLESSAFSGQFLVIGVVVLMVGVIGHSARRRGRTDQIADKALAKAEGR